MTWNIISTMSFGTTDPYYIDPEVRLSPSPEHSTFLDRAGRNLEAFLELRGRLGPITREVMIQDLEALPAHPGLTRSRYRIEPDLAMWPLETVIAPDRAVSWREQGAPLLVLECLSPATETKDREDNPIIYDLMGVAEYWICSPSDRHPMFGHQRTEAGAWGPGRSRCQPGSLVFGAADPYPDPSRTRLPVPRPGQRELGGNEAVSGGQGNGNRPSQGH